MLNSRTRAGCSQESDRVYAQWPTSTDAVDAHHSIRAAVQEQGHQEAAPVLLGDLSKVGRERQAQARDDPRLVRFHYHGLL